MSLSRLNSQFILVFDASATVHFRLFMQVASFYQLFISMSCVGVYGCGCCDVAECAVMCGCCDEKNNIEIQVIVKVFARFSPWHSPGIPYTTLILILIRFWFISFRVKRKKKRKMNTRHFDIESLPICCAHTTTDFASAFNSCTPQQSLFTVCSSSINEFRAMSLI